MKYRAQIKSRCNLEKNNENEKWAEESTPVEDVTVWWLSCAAGGKREFQTIYMDSGENFGTKSGFKIASWR
jgi:hypothetical protein